MQQIENGTVNDNDIDDGASHPFNICTNCECSLHRRILYGKFIINELSFTQYDAKIQHLYIERLWVVVQI
jgi:hypothetical protein